MNLSDWGRLDAAADRFVDAVELGRAASAPRRQVWNLGIGARTMFLLGRFEDAVDWAQRSCDLADQERWTAFRPWPQAWGAHARLALGVHPDVVREDAERAFALARHLQDPCWEGVSAKAIGLTYVAQHRDATGLRWFSEASAATRRVTDAYAWVDVDILLADADAALRLGDSARAEAVIQRAVRQAARGSMDDLLDRALRLVATTGRG